MNEIVDLFAQTSTEMMNGLKKSRSALAHNLSIGEANESIVRDFLRERLPKSIGVGRGEIIDGNGNRSRQLDVILYDTLRTPILWADDDKTNGLFPSECVIAVIEVKTSLRVSDVPGIVDNMLSVKNLDKSNFYSKNSASVIQYVNQVYDQEFEVAPTFYYVFAFEGQNLNAVCEQFRSRMAGQPLEKRVDCVVCIDRGLICWHDKTSDKYDCVPNKLTDVLMYCPTQQNNALLLFYLLVYRYLVQVQGGMVDLRQYLPKMVF